MAKFEFAQSMMAPYMHLSKQAARVRHEMQLGINFAQHKATYPRSTADLPAGRQSQDLSLPVLEVLGAGRDCSEPA